MNILFIWDGDYPWDIRVEKICKTLHKSGHKVHMVCRNIARRSCEEIYNHIVIHRLPYLPHWLGDLNKAYSFPAFFSPIWLWNIYKQARANNCELIIVRDLPLALAGLWVAKFLRKPCIFDMAECYPEMLRCTWQFEGRSFKNYFLRNPAFADWIEKVVLKHINQVWVMIEESRNRLLSMGIAAEKILIISNTPEVDRFTAQAIFIDKPRADVKPYTMIYVGLLNPSRGLDTVLNAVSRYIALNPQFKFIVVGKGKAEEALRKQISQLGLFHNVEMLGWIDNKHVPTLIAEADIGIVPHHICSHWNNTIPNKLFDYMAAGKPVIVSDVTPMKRIVEHAKCGLSYRDYDDADLCRAIDTLTDPALRKTLAQNGYSSITNQYNWKKEEIALTDAINKITIVN